MALNLNKKLTTSANSVKVLLHVTGKIVEHLMADGAGVVGCSFLCYIIITCFSIFSTAEGSHTWIFCGNCWLNISTEHCAKG